LRPFRQREKVQVQAVPSSHAESSHESGKVAAESAKLSRKLNRLTIWIIFAAFLSAIAAVVQAGPVIFTLFHPH
jgi:hypothetical protein